MFSIDLKQQYNDNKLFVGFQMLMSAVLFDSMSLCKSADANLVIDLRVLKMSDYRQVSVNATQTLDYILHCASTLTTMSNRRTWKQNTVLILNACSLCRLLHSLVLVNKLVVHS